ncbi:FUSC family protein [Salsuginibacillus kocurii]|uniref:FUSC family protein n=1 Tax=Salsuginibacillus kocurii TaxID=427078 RepID=UPI00036E1377|nr:aromatic acid exporter family protein [Salsuginibacillus kocurii]
MKLGARIFKTGLAIVLALYVAEWLEFESAMYAAIAATFAIQPSIYRTFQTILDQVQANIIGAVLAVVFALTFGHEPVIIGVVVMVAIGIILKLKLETSTIPLALVTIIIIMGNPTSDFIEFAASRFGLIMIGVFAAFLVNLFFLPPRHEDKLYRKVVDNTDEVLRWIRLVTRKETNQATLKKDIPRINETMLEMDNIYLLYKEERDYFLRRKLAKARKIVLFKEMLAAMKKAFTILRTIDRYENELIQMPDRMQRLVQHQLDHLTYYHERILLRYAGKVITQKTDDMAEEADEGEESLTDLFMDLYDHNEIDREQWLHVLPLVSHIVEYYEQLDHLDRLVESFFSYHRDENKVELRDDEFSP